MKYPLGSATLSVLISTEHNQSTDKTKAVGRGFPAVHFVYAFRHINKGGFRKNNKKKKFIISSFLSMVI